MSTEQMSVLLIGLVVLGPLFVISAVLMAGRGSSLIAGYNTMSPQEQQKWNRKALCHFLGVLLFVFSVLIGVSLLADAFFDKETLSLLSAVAGIVELAGGVLYMNKSSRFKQS